MITPIGCVLRLELVSGVYNYKLEVGSFIVMFDSRHGSNMDDYSGQIKDDNHPCLNRASSQTSQ